METLIRKYQVSCEDIDQMYIAGGFGYKLDNRKGSTDRIASGRM